VILCLQATHQNPVSLKKLAKILPLIRLVSGNFAFVDSARNRLLTVTAESHAGQQKTRNLLTFLAIQRLRDNPFERQDLTKPVAAARILMAGMTWLAICLIILVAGGLTARAQTASSERLDARGDSVQRWSDADGEFYILEGRCQLASPDGGLSADRLVIQVTKQAGAMPWRVDVVAQGRTRFNQESLKSPWRAQWSLAHEPTIDAPLFRGTAPAKPIELTVTAPPLAIPLAASPQAASPFQDTPSQVAQAQVAQAQFTQAPGSTSPTMPWPSPPPEGGAIVGPDEPLMPSPQPASENKFQLILGGGTRSVEVVSRSSATNAQIELQNREDLGESIVVARGGVTVLVRDVQAQLPGGERLDLGTVSLSADKVVGWLPLVTGLFSGTSSLEQAEGEFYLEGNIVFRQGDRVVYADSMYYNVTREYGMVLSAEAITPVPEYDGLVRLKADVLQQVASGEFIAFDAAVTTSRMGVPRYWLQSEQLRFSDQKKAAVDPISGAPVEVSDRVISSTGSFVYFGGVPILYWPTFSSDVTVPSFYITSIKIKRDNILGTQVHVDFDLFQLLGVDDPPDGVRWTLSTGYLSERGPALGTAITYNRSSFFGLPGPTVGFVDAWGLRDTGLDVLGQDRRDLVPEEEYRGRVLGRHRQWLPYDYELVAEVGYLSDRNFLEQYFENEYDRNKDHDTSLRLRKYYFNNLFELSAEAQLNEFYTETERLPSFDHYLLGGSVLGDRLTWSMHNQVGYADLNVADSPLDPVQDAITQTPLPGEVDAQGIIASTRQELSMPLELGPVKFVPFLSGEASRYGEDATGESLTRLIGQAGFRTALPMWRVDPNVQSSLLNVRGLAHKIELTGEYFYADSDANLDELPLYDPLDDDAQEEFRRRFFFSTFGGGLPARFDPRTYAYRQGLQRYVTNPSEVIADDAMQARLGLHQRWQTKRGVPGRERIVDLMRLDIDTVLFPDGERDNFGETIGPTTYDFRYHLGDRVTLLSDGYADFFEDGLKSVSAGVRTSRPGLGDVYVGLMSLEGPISATVFRSSYDYRLNEKWIFTAANTYDFGNTGNIGQTVALTRIGESLLLRMGLDIDEGRDNVGFVFAIEPRFFPTRGIGSLGGQLIPPPGLEGLE
jgi:hypothetical protein